MLDLPGGAAHYAISSFFDGYKQSDSVYSYRADLHDARISEAGRLKLAFGRAQITSRVTHAILDFNFAVLHGGGHNLCAGICQVNHSFPQFVGEVRRLMPQSDFAECSHGFDAYFGEQTYSLKSLFCDERRRIVGQLVDSTLADIDHFHSDVCEHHAALIGFLRELHMPLPPILRVSCEFALTNAMRRCLREKIDFAGARSLLKTAVQNGVAIDASIKSTLRQRLDALMKNWASDPMNLSALIELDQLASLMREPPFEADLWNAQNTFCEMTQLPSLKLEELDAQSLNHVRALGMNLGFAIAEPSCSTPAHDKTLSIAAVLPHAPAPLDSASAGLCV